MNRILLLITLVFGIATFGAGLYDLLGPTARAGLLHTGGEVWFALSSNTLNLMQAVTQRYLTPGLWDPGIVSILKLPAVATLGALAAIFAGLWVLMSRRATSQMHHP
ncbi:MAG: hypothetical protein RLN89_13165 [Parvibaculum sp.]